ncbi:MAG TPA: NAD-dependent epimerase/dehydratase family protein [Acidimicrobiales bacterium]|nr:NAD-dependent epimerase/dehydratase family protein [Acidimicrobiales bacterium]
MKILIVGGTSFVGRAIAWSAWHHGHDVAVVNRGITPNDLPEKIERLVGDRESDLSVLGGRSFDVTIDATAYRPSDVERLAAAIDDRGGHYVQISSVSAYSDPGFEGASETSLSLHSDDALDLEGSITGSTYGPLKAASERAGTEYFGDNVTFIRPTYVIGSYDATLRFPYWVERARRGGVIAVAGPRSNAIQYLDARDLANFVVRVADKHVVGAFHTTGPEPGDHYVEMVEQICAHVAPEGTEVREVSADKVLEAKLGAKFPLWSGKENSNISTLDSSLALAHGLDLRPIGESIDDVTAWWGDRAWPEHWLTIDDEARLLGL